MLTQAKLKELFHYCPNTGTFTRIKTITYNAKAGDIAGTHESNGYRRICIDGKNYRYHRLVWLYTYGVWPIEHIDHINGDPSDNRIINLREATSAQNNRNKLIRFDNKSGFKGVCLDRRRGKWLAQCTIDKNYHFLGYYASAKLASVAYESFTKIAYGEFYPSQLGV